MKTKLLKKIKKRFDYYRNRDGKYILIDNKYKRVLKMDFETLKERNLISESVKNEEELKNKIRVSLDEFYFRSLKSIIYIRLGLGTWGELIFPKLTYKLALKKIREGHTL